MADRPPFNEELERTVIGQMLMGENAVLDAIGVLDKVPQPFYFDKHRLLYAAICGLYRQGVTPDVVSLTTLLQKNKTLDEVGGAYEIADIVRSTSTTANTEFYCLGLLDLWKKRELQALGKKIVKDAGDVGIEGGEIVKELQIAGDAIANVRPDKNDDSPKYAANEAFNRIVAMRNREIKLTTSYYDAYNVIAGGYQEADVIIVAARPSIGKTAYVLSELRHQSYTMEVPTAFVSLDSMRRNIMFRLFAQTAQVDVKKMRIGFLNQDELDRLQYAKSLHERKKLIVDDIPMNIADIRTRVKRMKLKYDIQILAVDFVQLVGGSGKRNQTREREVSEVSLMLKNVAKEFELTTILLSQLNRAVDYRPDKRPILADLRDSGSLEQDADIVLFLSRPEYYGEEYFDKEKRFPAKNKAEVIIAKGRDVGTGAFKLEFEKSCAHFKNIADSSVIIDIPNNPGTQRYEYEEKNHNYGYDDDEAPF